MARIIDAFSQFFDDNGDPLADGYLKFNESGTNNTDKDIFYDINEQIPAPNPFKLDGAGRCGNVFGTGTYNVISYHNDGSPYPGAPGAQIEQFDPVSSDPFRGAFSDWDAVTIYGVGDIVTGSDSLYYRSIIANNQNQDPTSSPGQWEEIRVLGLWNSVITYAVGQGVYGSDGFLYISRTAANTGNDPTTDTTNWRPGANIRFVKGADLGDAELDGSNILTLGTDGNYFDMDGSQQMDGIATVGVGTIVKIHFDTVRQLTNDNTNFDLGGTNITTSIGAEAEFFEYAVGDWRMTNYRSATSLTKSTIRQTVLAGAVAAATGFASFLSDGGVLDVDLDATPTNLSITYADGFDGDGPVDVAELISEKDQYQIGEMVNLSVKADSLYQVINWDFGNFSGLDTVDMLFQPDIAL